MRKAWPRADLHGKELVDPIAPDVGPQHVAVLVDVGKTLPVVVVDVANSTLQRGCGDAPPQGVVCVGLRELAVGRDGHELVLAVPRQVERRLAVALDARDVPRRVI